jgi:branched-chain amino acid transport system substrate-binding protein
MSGAGIMMRRTFLFAVLCSLALGLIGCPPPADSGGGGGSGGESSGEGVRIAVVGPVTGSNAANGESMKRGASLAIKQFNDAGGLNGSPVGLQVEDDKGEPNEATNIAKKLVSDDSVPIVVGHFNSACTNAAKDTYNNSGLVEFTPASTNVTICRGAEWTFRNLYHDDYQGRYIAYYVKNKLGHDTAAIAFENDDYGRGLKEAITAYAAEYGLEIVAEVNWIRERNMDFKTPATSLQEAKPQTVIIAGLYNEALLLSKVIRNDLGWSDVTILGSDGVMDDTVIKQGGEAAEGMLITTPFFFSADASESAKAFGEAYKAEFQEDPNTWAALTYDAVNMALQGLQEVGADRAKIKAWLEGKTTPESGVEGVTGATYFDAHGDCYSKPAQTVVVRNGAFELAEKQVTPEELPVESE